LSYGDGKAGLQPAHNQSVRKPHRAQGFSTCLFAIGQARLPRRPQSSERKCLGRRGSRPYQAWWRVPRVNWRVPLVTNPQCRLS